MWAITTQREEFTSRASYSPFNIVVLDDDGSVGGGMVVLVLMAEASIAFFTKNINVWKKIHFYGIFVIDSSATNHFRP